MLPAVRIFIILASALFFWGAWYLFPLILERDSLRWFAGLVTVLWGLELAFFKKLDEVAGVKGLSVKERERLSLRLGAIRNRIWWVGVMGLVSSVLMWAIAGANLAPASPLAALCMGVLIGISASYLVLIPAWFDESQAFIDEVKKNEEIVLKRERELKLLTDGK